MQYEQKQIIYNKQSQKIVPKEDQDSKELFFLEDLYCKKIQIIEKIQFHRRNYITSENQIQPLPESQVKFVNSLKRQFSQWDFVIEEMKQMALDFREERKAKVAMFFHLSKRTQKLQGKLRNHKLELELCHKLISSEMASMVKQQFHMVHQEMLQSTNQQQEQQQQDKEGQQMETELIGEVQKDQVEKNMEDEEKADQKEEQIENTLENQTVKNSAVDVKQEDSNINQSVADQQNENNIEKDKQQLEVEEDNNADAENNNSKLDKEETKLTQEQTTNNNENAQNEGMEQEEEHEDCNEKKKSEQKENSSSKQIASGCVQDIEIKMEEEQFSIKNTENNKSQHPKSTNENEIKVEADQQCQSQSRSQQQSVSKTEQQQQQISDKKENQQQLQQAPLGVAEALDESINKDMKQNMQIIIEEFGFQLEENIKRIDWKSSIEKLRKYLSRWQQNKKLLQNLGNPKQPQGGGDDSVKMQIHDNQYNKKKRTQKNQSQLQHSNQKEFSKGGGMMFNDIPNSGGIQSNQSIRMSMQNISNQQQQPPQMQQQFSQKDIIQQSSQSLQGLNQNPQQMIQSPMVPMMKQQSSVAGDGGYQNQQYFQNQNQMGMPPQLQQMNSAIGFSNQSIPNSSFQQVQQQGQGMGYGGNNVQLTMQPSMSHLQQGGGQNLMNGQQSQDDGQMSSINQFIESDIQKLKGYENLDELLIFNFDSTEDEFTKVFTNTSSYDKKFPQKWEDIPMIQNILTNINQQNDILNYFSLEPSFDYKYEQFKKFYPINFLDAFEDYKKKKKNIWKSSKLIILNKNPANDFLNTKEVQQQSNLTEVMKSYQYEEDMFLVYDHKEFKVQKANQNDNKQEMDDMYYGNNDPYHQNKQLYQQNRNQYKQEWPFFMYYLLDYYYNQFGNKWMMIADAMNMNIASKGFMVYDKTCEQKWISLMIKKSQRIINPSLKQYPNRPFLKFVDNQKYTKEIQDFIINQEKDDKRKKQQQQPQQQQKQQHKVFEKQKNSTEVEIEIVYNEMNLDQISFDNFRNQNNTTNGGGSKNNYNVFNVQKRQNEMLRSYYSYYRLFRDKYQNQHQKIQSQSLEMQTKMLDHLKNFSQIYRNSNYSEFDDNQLYLKLQKKPDENKGEFFNFDDIEWPSKFKDRDVLTRKKNVQNKRKKQISDKTCPVIHQIFSYIQQQQQQRQMRPNPPGPNAQGFQQQYMNQMNPQSQQQQSNGTINSGYDQPQLYPNGPQQAGNMAQGSGNQPQYQKGMSNQNIMHQMSQNPYNQGPQGMPKMYQNNPMQGPQYENQMHMQNPQPMQSMQGSMDRGQNPPMKQYSGQIAPNMNPNMQMPSQGSQPPHQHNKPHQMHMQNQQQHKHPGPEHQQHMANQQGPHKHTGQKHQHQHQHQHQHNHQQMQPNMPGVQQQSSQQYMGGHQQMMQQPNQPPQQMMGPNNQNMQGGPYHQMPPQNMSKSNVQQQQQGSQQQGQYGMQPQQMNQYQPNSQQMQMGQQDQYQPQQYYDNQQMNNMKKQNIGPTSNNMPGQNIRYTQQHHTPMPPGQGNQMPNMQPMNPNMMQPNNMQQMQGSQQMPQQQQSQGGGSNRNIQSGNGSSQGGGFQYQIGDVNNIKNDIMQKSATKKKEPAEKRKPKRKTKGGNQDPENE